MKTKDLRDKSDAELRDLLAETRERLRATRFSVSTMQETRVHEVREARRTIARTLTILKERQLRETA